MGIPFIFLFKNIFDYIVYFYNFRGDFNELVKNQINCDILSGLLMNEIGPSALTISFHNLCHCLQSIIDGGDLVSTSCFVSERSYRFIKKNIYPCNNAELTGGKRYMTLKIADCVFAAYFNTTENEIQVNDTGNDLTTIRITENSSNIVLNEAKQKRIIQINAFDDAMYYSDTSYCHNTLFDQLWKQKLTILSEEITVLIDKYVKSSHSDIHNIIVDDSPLSFHKKI